MYRVKIVKNNSSTSFYDNMYEFYKYVQFTSIFFYLVPKHVVFLLQSQQGQSYTQNLEAYPPYKHTPGKDGVISFRVALMTKYTIFYTSHAVT